MYQAPMVGDVIYNVGKQGGAGRGSRVGARYVHIQAHSMCSMSLC